MNINFYEGIYRRLLENQDYELMVWPDDGLAERVYTGRDILNRVSAIRNELVSRQVRPGQPVLLATPVTFDLICTLLAIMALGAIPVLPPAAASLRTLLSLIIKGNIHAVVTRQQLKFPLSWLAKRIGIVPVSTEGIPASSSEWCPPQPVDPGQPALISHSSGSTGTAKPIRRSHRVLLAQHQALSQAFPSWPGQRDFPLFPAIVLHNLALGTVNILPDLPGFKLTGMAPVRIVQQIVSQRVQTLTGNVYYVQRLLQHLRANPLTFPHVRAVGIGGSPVPEPLVYALQEFFVRADVYIIYGSSEAEPIAVRKIGPEPLNPRFGYAVGVIHPSLEVEIRTVGTLDFADGRSYQAGEIAVKGPHVTTAGNDWFRTGDFGYLDETNQLFLTGRQGNERLHRGVQHYQVEHVLAHVNGVERVAARSTERGFTVYIQGKAGEATLRKTLNENFPEGLFNQLYFRENLPVDSRHLSKIHYQRLT